MREVYVTVTRQRPCLKWVHPPLPFLPIPPRPPPPTLLCFAVFYVQHSASYAISGSDDPNETSVLVEAARTGSGEMIEAVVAAMYDLLTEEKVCVRLLLCVYSSCVCVL